MKKYILPVIALIFATFAFAAPDKVVQIFCNGELVNEYGFSDDEYANQYVIQVNDRPEAPINLVAQVDGNSVNLSWDAIDGATYDVYRSETGAQPLNSFERIATGLSDNSYLDVLSLNGTYYYRVKAVDEVTVSGFSASCTAILDGSSSAMESGLYLGIMGFNQQLYPYPITQLTTESKGEFDTFINNMTTKNGTLLYYSVDEAINTLQRTAFPDDLYNVAVVTFTDGLDQGSMMLNSLYATDDEYLSALNTRIKNETVSGQEITAYSIGIRSSDISDIDKFSLNLQMIASSPENATEVTNMSEVSARFKEIAEQLSKTNYLQTISLGMPGQANGTRVRFTFDNVTNANMSQLYIEGVFNLTTKSLENVVYKGMTSTSGTSVKGSVDGISVSFTFEGVATDSKQLISRTYINEWTYINSTASWQINSEFDKYEESEIVKVKKSAAIMLVLDNSSSLGTQFVSVQNNAKSFIATLLNSVTEGDSETPPGGDTGGDVVYPSDGFSTVPLDLSLAVWRDGVRYYVTQAQYEQMGGNLSGYQVEGVTVLSGTGNFIIDLHNAGLDAMTHEAAKLVWGDFLPTKAQGITISAKFTDINNALSAFGGTKLSSNSGYWTSYTDSYRYDYYICGSGGILKDTSSSSTTTCFVRRVSSIKESLIEWTTDNDLSVIIKDAELNEYYMSPSDYYVNATNIAAQGHIVMGVRVYYNSNKSRFDIELNDAQSGTITQSSALSVYGNYLPTYDEGKVISARFTDINNALSASGGTKLSSNSRYWTSYTDSYRYDYYIYGSGGILKDTSSSSTTCFVRRVHR